MENFPIKVPGISKYWSNYLIFFFFLSNDIFLKKKLFRNNGVVEKHARYLGIIAEGENISSVFQVNYKKCFLDFGRS